MFDAIKARRELGDKLDVMWEHNEKTMSARLALDALYRQDNVSPKVFARAFKRWLDAMQVLAQHYTECAGS